MMSEISPIKANFDVKADLTKPIEDVASIAKDTHKGLGKVMYALCGPMMERRIGIAKRIAAQADRDAQDILEGRKRYELESRQLFGTTDPSNLDMLCYELAQADNACKAKRLAQAIMEVAKEIKQIPENEISDEPVNQTFFNHWKEEAELIDDEDLRQIWAKLLVDETRKPNSVSPRTLSVVKNLSKSDAEIFERLGLCIVGNNIVVDSKDHPLNGEYQDILTLQDAGLLGQKSSSWYGSFANDTVFIPLSNQNYILAANCNNKVTFSCHILTQAGTQLLKYLNKPDDIKYFQMAAREISKQNNGICLRIIPISDGKIYLESPGIWSTDLEKAKDTK